MLHTCSKGKKNSLRGDDLGFGRRPDPVGRSYTPDHGDDAGCRQPPNHLAPLKKKKKAKKAAVANSEDELYEY